MISNIRNDRIAEVYQLAKDAPTMAYNCWGASRYLAGLQDELSWYNDKEAWLKYLTTHAKPVRTVQVGDILAIVEGEELMHTATVLSVLGGTPLYLHKQGANTAEVATYEQVRVTYRKGKATHYRLQPIKLTLK